MDLGFRDRALNAIEIDFTILLSFDGGYEIRIESEFWLFDSDGKYRIAPDPDFVSTAARLQGLSGTVALTSIAEETGRLRIDFVNGAAILVHPDKHYEAWTFAGPDGAKVISIPGGELAVWNARS